MRNIEVVWFDDEELDSDLAAALIRVAPHLAPEIEERLERAEPTRVQIVLQ
ncbi:MAG: hypothetical protein H7312_18120 [Tardiphaga sp.]|jgi:hypothetical protein|nr:hypothetical protein [Tardiphaga sp.]